MNDRLTLQRLLPLLQGVQKLSNGQYLARCPAHDDREPSLCLAESPEGKLLVKCHAGCLQETVLRALRELASPAQPQQKPKPKAEPVGLTLKQYADAKRLNPEQLGQWYVSDTIYQGKEAIKIEYRDIDGQLIATQYRLALSGDRFRWKAGDAPKLYGLWRLREWHGGMLWVVEGASDCHTLWSAGIPAIAIPSASGSKLAPELWKRAEPFQHIYFCIDADSAGAELLKAVTDACPPALQERVQVVRLPEGVKDVSELWLQVSDAEQFRQALESAPKTPLPPTQESTEGNPFGTLAETEVKGKMDAHLRALEALWQGMYRYCVEWKVWLHWNGQYWETIPDIEKILNEARETLINHYAHRLTKESNEEERKWIYKLIEDLHSSTRALKNAIELLQGREGYRTLAREWDAHPELLNTPAGIVNLRTLEIIPHAPEYLMTRITQARPEAIDTPQWNRFLQRIFAGDTALIRFLQKALGTALLGYNREQRMYILWGQGANGKSTLVNTLLYALGGYARAIPRDAIMRDGKAQDAKRVSHTALEKVRFGVLEELEEGAVLSAVAVKTLTSNNPIDVRGLYERNRQIQLQITPFICTNIKPHLTELTDAIWRRLILIPFTVVIPESERDPDLLNKLKGEADGILSWLLEGLQAYWREGLNPPPEVLAATAEYRSAEDVLADFLDTCCEFSPKYRVASTDLYQAYKDWHGSDDDILSPEEFARILKARGYQKHKVKGRMVWTGLRLKNPPLKPTDTDGGRVGEGLDGFSINPHGDPPNCTQVFNGNPAQTLPTLPPEQEPAGESDLADLLALRPHLAQYLVPLYHWAKHNNYPKLPYSAYQSVAQGRDCWIQFLKTASAETLETIYNIIIGGK